MRKPAANSTWAPVIANTIEVGAEPAIVRREPAIQAGSRLEND